MKMTLKEISFDLPQNLIAQKPSDKRGEDRLLVLSTKTGKRSHLDFRDITSLLEPGTLCVVNNSKVRKARLILKDQKNREIQALFVHPVGQNRWAVLMNKAQRRKVSEQFQAPGHLTFTLVKREGELWLGDFSGVVDEPYFEKFGHVPLPPYMQREDNPEDEDRYQTVYAQVPGSAAAPTAGLHFTQDILLEMERKGIMIKPVTLHVGLGTFIPIRSENVLEHHMHQEEYEVPQVTAQELNKALDDKRPILAVGTTSIRTLEAAVEPSGRFVAKRGKTDLYITPGYQFKVTQFLLTNFHTPGSTLLLLVAALAGLDLVLETYREAISKEYRFFSYGDAMLFDPR